MRICVCRQSQRQFRRVQIQGCDISQRFCCIRALLKLPEFKSTHPAIPSVLITYRAQEASGAAALAKQLWPSQHYLWSVNHDCVRKESRNDTSPRFITEELGHYQRKGLCNNQPYCYKKPMIYVFFKKNLKNWREKNLLRAALNSGTTVESGSMMIARRLFWKSATRYLLPPSQ